MDVSTRGEHLLALPNPAHSMNATYYANPWSLSNPEGVVNLSTAANFASQDLLKDWLGDLKDCAPDTRLLFHYPKPGGYTELLETVATFLNESLCPNNPVSAEQLVAVPGGTAAFDMLAFALCQPEDCVLCPAPYYSRVVNNMGERGLVRVIPVDVLSNMTEGEEFRYRIDRFEEAFDKAKAAGKRVKGIVLLNPDNPSAVVHSSAEVVGVVEFARERELFVIADELYALSVFGDDSGFESALNLHYDALYWMWSLSKDWCMPGARLGVVHCRNARVRECLRRLETLQPAAPLVQQLAVDVLSRPFDSFLDGFQAPKLAVLRAGFRLLADGLTAAGVRVFGGQAALYVLCDMRKFLNEDTFEAELELWKRFRSAGVIVTAGKFMNCPTPGWFRVVFSGQTLALQTGIDRIQKVLRNESVDS